MRRAVRAAGVAALCLLIGGSPPLSGEGPFAWGADKWERLTAVYEDVFAESGHDKPTRLHLAKEYPTIEGAPAVALSAKVGQNPHDVDLVMVASAIFDLAKDPEEMGFMFAHELQHLILEHPRKYNEHKLKLMDEWAAAELEKGRDIYGGAGPVDEVVDEFFAEYKARVDVFQVRLENEADRLAVPLMCKCGIDPRAALRVLGRGNEWVSAVGGEHGAEHAEPEERVRLVRRAIRDLDVEACGY